MVTFFIICGMILLTGISSHPIFAVLAVTCWWAASQYSQNQIDIRDAASMDRPE